MYYENKHPKPTGFVKFILKAFVKKYVTNEVTYKKGSKTAPQFIITDEKEFEIEKERLKNYIIKTQELGASHFEGKESHSFGKLNSKEWNNMFAKHLDHHFTQFGI
jgi:SRSO17 transposase